MPNIEITTIIGCSNDCSYCPQDTLIKAYSKDKHKLMTFEEFKNILSNVPKEVDIFFAGYSEAFLNKHSSAMMRHAIEEGRRVVLYTTLSGFTYMDLHILMGLEFDTVSFHRYEGHKEDFDIKVEVFKKYIKAKTWSAEKIINPISRAGNLWEEQIQVGKFYCAATKKFDHNVVLPNGDVYLCCMDYALTNPIGNLYTTNFYDLDRSEVIKKSNEEVSDINCRKCFLFQSKP